MALALCACNKINEIEEQPVVPAGPNTVTFTAEFTKTATTDDHTVTWVAGDAVKFVWEGGSATAYASSSGTSTSFTVEVGADAEVVYAVYPASAGGSYDDGDVNVHFNGSRTDGSFAANDICVAKAVKTGDTWSTSLAFKNVACLMKVTVTSSDITRLQVAAVGGEAISGLLPVSIDGSGNVSTGTPSSTGSTVNMTVSTPGDYYIPVIPGNTLSRGFRINRFEGDSQVIPFFYNGIFVTTRGKIFKFNDIDAHAGQYYVTPSGAGTKSGQSWSNAMNADSFKSFIQNSDNYFLLRNATIHLSAEEFIFGDYLQPDFSGHGETPFTIEGTKSGSDITTFVGGTGSTAGTLWPQSSCNLTVKNVKFTGTNGSSNRGAIRVNTAGVKLKLKDCSFDNNSTTGNGGAICLYKGDVTIEDCGFNSNSSVLGAAIYVEGATNLSVSGSTFDSNTASHNTADFGGGAIYIKSQGATVEINGCTFTNNQATNKCGGAICVKDGEGETALTLNDCTFSENYAKGWGGAILFKVSGTMDVTDCEFNGNYAGGDSGAINPDIATCTFTRVSFTGNHADGDFGGVMWADTGDYTFTECEFNGNYTTKGGGVIYIHSAANYSFTDCDFINNHADMGGGAVCIVNGGAEVSFTRGKFQGNHADGDGLKNGSNDDSVISAGGAIYATGSGVTFDCTDVLFKENYTYVSGTNNQIGGIIRVQQGNGLARFNHCVFDGNYTIRNFQDNQAAAAIITCRIGGVKYYFNACEFKENTSGLESWKTSNKQGGCKGTVIASYRSSKICMNNCSMHDNYGARDNDEISWIYVDNPSNTLLISNSTIVGDPTQYNGNRKNEWGVIKLHSYGNYYFINNILCSEFNTADSQTLWCGTVVQQGTTVYSYFNKTSPEVDGRINWGTDTGSGHDYFATSSYFGNWSEPYTWKGTLTGTNSNMLAATADVNTEIQNADSDFYSWLNSIGALGKDINGNNRGATSWPGCYQE